MEDDEGRLTRRRPTGVFATGTLLVLGALAAAWFLPSRLLTWEANRRLKAIPGYRAGVERVRLTLVPFGLSATNFHLEKREDAAPAVFLSLPAARVEVAPGPFFSGRYRLKVRLERPAARFLMRQRRPGQPRKFALWQPVFARLPAFRVSELVIVDGALRLQNGEDIPPLDLAFDQIHSTATNLANRPGHTRGRPRLEGRARMMGHAPLTLTVESTPFQERAEFRLRGALTGFNLASLNPVLRHYTGVDLESGVMDVEGDLTASRGGFRGRVRRSLRGLKMITGQERHGGFVPLMKEVLLQTWLNRRKDAAGDISGDYALSGPLGYMNADVFLAAVWTAKSVFLQSLRPTLPPEVVMGAPQRAEDEWMALQARERAKRAKK